jgi:uncharacterized protein
VRIEVGYGLEPIVTDALSEVIIQQAVLPRFRAGDFDGGTEAGVAALLQQLSLDPSAAEARAAAAQKQLQKGEGSGASPLSILIIIIFVAIAFSRIFGGFGFWPLLFLGGPRYGGGRGFGGGGFGGRGGGGWSGGGGGSFGGGGASGSW